MNTGETELKTQRTLPPAASPIGFIDIAYGIAALRHGGKTRERFKSELQQYFGVKHVFLVSSGKAALFCILKALHKLHPDRNEVLVPAFNCYSVPSAVLAAGLKIRLCDIDPNTLDFGPSELSKAIIDTKRLLCVIPTHLFGLHADVKGLRSLIKDDALVIVEDAAQAMGSHEDGRMLGLSGDVGFFSLGRGKAFSTYEGGVIVTNNEVIGKCIDEAATTLPEYSPFQVLKLIVNAIAVTALGHPMLFWIPKSLPFLKLGETLFEHSFLIKALSPFQAGLAWNWEKTLERLRTGRNINALWWANFFRDRSVNGIFPVIASKGPVPDALRFPVIIENDKKREAVLRESHKMGMGISVTYPRSLDELPELKDFNPAPCPHARACARTLVTLPVHEYVSEHDREKLGRIVTG